MYNFVVVVTSVFYDCVFLLVFGFVIVVDVLVGVVFLFDSYSCYCPY